MTNLSPDRLPHSFDQPVGLPVGEMEAFIAARKTTLFVTENGQFVFPDEYTHNSPIVAKVEIGEFNEPTSPQLAIYYILRVEVLQGFTGFYTANVDASQNNFEADPSTFITLLQMIEQTYLAQPHPDMYRLVQKTAQEMTPTPFSPAKFRLVYQE